MPTPLDSGLRCAGGLAAGGLIALVAALLAAVACACRSDGSAPHSPLEVAADSLLCHNVPYAEPHTYIGFKSYFDGSVHMPRCVTYLLSAGKLGGDYTRSEAFAADSSVAGCPPPDAYKGSGLHRGHLAPAADMQWDELALQQTFFMTNICPQDASLNEGGWANLEEKCREWVRRDGELVVACGPIIDPSADRLLASGIRVPRQYFKVILAPRAMPPRAIAFVYPNSAASGGALRRYATTVHRVEQLTGIDFFCLVDSALQQQLETRANLQLWLH